MRRWAVDATTWAARTTAAKHRMDGLSGLQFINKWNEMLRHAGSACVGAQAGAAAETGSTATSVLGSAGEREESVCAEKLMGVIAKELHAGAIYKRRAHMQHMSGHSRHSRVSGREVHSECELMHRAVQRFNVLLRHAVAFAATASRDTRMLLRRCAAKLRRRIVRIIAIKQLLSGHRIRCSSRPEWLADPNE